MKKNSLIRTIYLYLFTIVGLFLIVFAAIDFIDMGLRAFVFTQADEQQRLYYEEPPFAPYDKARLQQITTDADGGTPDVALTEAEREQIREWLASYTAWQEKRESIDPVTAERHRKASTNIAMMLVGIPLYLFHWGIIKRETKRNKDDA